ncbi:MAG: ribosome small subunit-dependent GTPase A [Bacilli bacterium]|jgi:ribosome biogenesis GTPase|nr:ribosome small subunit-dependent GTPase A [Bacilli bacterium]
MQQQLKRGKIIRIISNLYTVELEDKTLDCHARGKFRKEKITPLVGDFCYVDEENHYILEIEPRKNVLERPTIANMDFALIVTSVKLPNLSLNLLDKTLSLMLINKIEPILCFTKLDLLNEEEQKQIDKIINYYKKCDYQVVKNTELDKIKRLLSGKQIVLTGQTGAGKSTLLNKLSPNLHLKTDEISLALGRGKHTTRHVELFKIEDFFIADTPGFSALEIKEIEKEAIKESFKEFNQYTCPFKNCFHDKEKECRIKEAVLKEEILLSRYQNYLDFINR